MFRHIRFVAALAVTLNLAACAGAPEESDRSGLGRGGSGPEDTASTADDSAELRSTTAHFETFVGADSKHYFELVAGNGQNVLRSQAYTRLASAREGIEAVLESGVVDASYALRMTRSGTYYFNLVGKNGEIIATSEVYASKWNAQRAIRTVRGLVELVRGPRQVVEAPGRESFEVFTGEDGQEYFHLRAANGEIVLSSAGYDVRAGALAGIESVREAGREAASYTVFETHDGQYSFNLVAANGEPVGRGESYVSKANAERGVSAVIALLAGQVRVEEPARTVN